MIAREGGKLKGRRSRRGGVTCGAAVLERGGEATRERYEIRQGWMMNQTVAFHGRRPSKAWKRLTRNDLS